MIAMPQKKPPSRETNFISSTKSTASLPSSMKASAIPLLVCLLLGISDLSDVLVVGFATTSRAVGRETRLGLVSISQDVNVAPILSSSSPLSSSQVHRTILRKGEGNTIEDSIYDLMPSTSSSSTSTTALLAVQSSENDGSEDTSIKNIGTNKRNFFDSLDTMETLNGASKERSALLAKMIDEKKLVAVGEKSKEELASSSSSSSIIPTVSYEKPGSTETFLASGTAAPVAEGTWKVVYAPHMTTAMDLFRGKFEVSYDLFSDSRIVSHAYYDFPIVGKGYLSVSGTYGSVANDATDVYSRVDFDKAWIKALPSSPSSSSPTKLSAAPYDSLDAVPDSLPKTIINEIGKRAFVESVAVFPVSFLDDDTIVFEFEFLGTKICAHKV